MNYKAVINIAKSELGLENDDYRAMLERVTGKASLRAMNDNELAAVVEEMKRLGFVKKSKSKKPLSDKRYVRQIFALWRSCAEKGVIESSKREACVAFVKKMTGVEDPNWLTYDEASPVIEALKQMEGRR